MERDLIIECLAPGSDVPATVRRVASFIHQNRPLALASSAAELALRLGVSDATVIRSIQAIGFETLADLRRALVASLSDGRTPADALRRTLRDVGPDIDDAISSALHAQMDNMRALQTRSAQGQISAAVRALHRAARVVVFGIGPSRGIADYICRVLTRNGIDALPIGTTGRALADQIARLRAGDGLIIMAYGKIYHELAVLLEEAQRLSLPIVVITDTIAQQDLPATVTTVTIVSAMRGREGHTAVHATIVVVLETIALALALARSDETIGALDRLNTLRAKLTTP
jgi:DNA-binding MurR/RpiR family transcriptional regulator